MTSKGIHRLRVVESGPQPTPEPGPPPTDTPESEPAPTVTDQPDPIAVLQAGYPQTVAEVNQLMNALAAYGVDLRETIDPRFLRPRVESFSACRMLVLKGICTEEEMQVLVVEAQRDLLRGILQAAENQRHEQQRRLRDVVVPEKPGLLIAKH